MQRCRHSTLFYSVNRKLQAQSTPFLGRVIRLHPRHSRDLQAFFDISHAPADQSNRRTDLQGYAAWEIHPVMKLTPQ
jgi:hypothetical protein